MLYQRLSCHLLFVMLRRSPSTPFLWFCFPKTKKYCPRSETSGLHMLEVPFSILRGMLVRNAKALIWVNVPVVLRQGVFQLKKTKVTLCRNLNKGKASAMTGTKDRHRH